MDVAVTVVLCTHNGEQYLGEQLDSLTAQTRPPSRIIASDDASTDSTRDILEAYRRTSSVPMEVLHNDPGLGYKNNFLRAALKAETPWVAFCDQDDVWDPTKLERCSPALGDDEVSQVAHTATLINRSGQALGSYSQGITSDAVRPPLYFDVWKTFSGFSMVVRRDLFDLATLEQRFAPHEEVGERVLAHDRWSFFLAHTVGRTVEIAAPLVRYRQHDRNVIGTSRRTWRSKVERSRRSEVLQGHRRLVDEAEAMLNVVRSLPDHTKNTFPAFDHQAAVAFYQRVLDRTLARESIYQSSPISGLRQVLSGTFGDVYRTKNGRARNWESVVKDLSYCATPRA